MKIKLTKDFLNLEGKVMNDEKECCILKPDGSLAQANGAYITQIVPTPDNKLELKKVCINSLLQDSKEDAANPDEKYEKYKLFQKFHTANGEIELEAKEVEMVKKYIGKLYSTYIMGQAYDMLEGK
jgi:hypothetical protein